MLNDAVGTHITHCSAIQAEAIGAGRNFVSSGDLHVHGRIQNHTKISTCCPRQEQHLPIICRLNK
jgi:hypothetical protein